MQLTILAAKRIDIVPKDINKKYQINVIKKTTDKQKLCHNSLH